MRCNEAGYIKELRPQDSECLLHPLLECTEGIQQELSSGEDYLLIGPRPLLLN